MTKAPTTVLSALRARVGRSQLVVGIGVLAAVLGAVLAAPIAMGLMHWAQSSQQPWLVTVTHALVSRLWVYLVLPVIWLGLSWIIVDLRPWPVAAGSAAAGELAYVMLDWLSGTLTAVLHMPSVWVPRVLTLLLGIVLSARAIRWSQSIRAKAPPAGTPMTTANAREARLVVGMLVACVSVMSLSAWQFAPNVGQAAQTWPNNYVVQSLVRWDAGWYETIATAGYWYRPGQQSPVAFFPLYPLVVRAWMMLGMNVWLAGVVTAAIAGFAALLLFARWAQTLAPEDVARRSLWLIALYPFSFYLYGVMYSDSLFLLLALGAFLCLEKDRIGAATLLGALATAARPVAPALVVGLLARRIEWRLGRGERVRVVDFLPLGAGLGFALYVSYLGVSFGDPFAFVHVQSAPGWDQPPGWHSWLKVTMLETLLDHPTRGIVLRYAAHTGVTLGLLALVPATYFRLGKGYAVYLFLAVALPAFSSKDFMGMGRYALAAFPAFLTLAHLLRPTPRLGRVWLAVSLILLLFLAAEFGATRYIS